MEPQDLYGKTIVRVEQDEHKQGDNIKRLWFSDGSLLELSVHRGDDDERYRDCCVGEFKPSQRRD
jgi:hypothetical protein